MPLDLRQEGISVTNDVKWVVGTALRQNPEPALKSQADLRHAICT